MVSFMVGGRGFPYRRILSLGAMGMGAWPDSRVVRRSSSESVDFPQKGKNVFWLWNIPRKEIRNYPWRESSYFFAAHRFGFRPKNGFRTEEHFWSNMSYFTLNKCFFQKVFTTWGRNPEKSHFLMKKKNCGHTHISTRILSIILFILCIIYVKYLF